MTTEEMFPKTLASIRRSLAEDNYIVPDEVTIRRAIELGWCSFLPGSWDKRFARDMASVAASEGPAMTLKQIENINRLAWKYRKQIPSSLVPEPPK